MTPYIPKSTPFNVIIYLFIYLCCKPLLCWRASSWSQKASHHAWNPDHERKRKFTVITYFYLYVKCSKFVALRIFKYFCDLNIDDLQSSGICSVIAFDRRWCTLSLSVPERRVWSWCRRSRPWKSWASTNISYASPAAYSSRTRTATPTHFTESTHTSRGEWQWRKRRCYWASCIYLLICIISKSTCTIHFHSTFLL